MPIIRQILGRSHTVIYLSFDDGPDPMVTPRVLDLLKTEGAQASFFVIGTKAKQNPKILRRMIAEGHSVGSHSWDHRYRNLFRGRTHLQKWVLQGEAALEAELGTNVSIGFRPPAGILTPPLMRVLDELEIPVFLWSKRFYDAVLPLSRVQVLRSLESSSSGEIVLLHDSHRARDLEVFLDILRTYIQRGRELGFSFEKLPRVAASSQVLSGQSI